MQPIGYTLDMDRIIAEAVTEAALIIAGASCPIRDQLYGGLPTGGGYGTATEYEIGAQRLAEAVHCILGSLGRHIGKDRDDWAQMIRTQSEHIREETGIIKKVVGEYAKDVYTKKMESKDPRRFAYNRRSIENIQKVSPHLKKLALDQFNKLKREEDIPEEVRNVGLYAFGVLHIFAHIMGQSVKDGALDFNAFGSGTLKKAIRKLESGVVTLLKAAR